jgi:serine/threonine-protein kinase
MARVYLARANGPGGFARHVVLKTMPAERRDDDAFVAMFLDEARLIATLHHQHIAQVFEVGCADDGRYFLAMEYVHGETVRNLLEAASKRRVKLPLGLGLSIASAAAAGLHHAHERRDLDGTPLGIVHRDVSPSNLILGFDGSIKLIDFGIAKATLRTTQTATGFIKGKVGYMAPEQARGYEVDRRSDVFALGVLAYELTTQSRAFHAESQFESMRRTVDGEIEPPTRRVPGFPPALEDVIMTALEIDPDDRFQDAEAMRVAFEQVGRELGLSLGASPVIRALESLFPARPEPWLVPDEASLDDDVTTDVHDSSPLIMVVPRTPTNVRLARGTETPDMYEDVERAPRELPELTTEPFERSISPHLTDLAIAAMLSATDQAQVIARAVTQPSLPATQPTMPALPPSLPVRRPPSSLPLPASPMTPVPVAPPSVAEPLPVVEPPSAVEHALPVAVASLPPRITTSTPVPSVTDRRALTMGAAAIFVVGLTSFIVVAAMDSSPPATQSRPASTPTAIAPRPTPAPAPAPSRTPAPRAPSPARPASAAPATVLLHVTTEPAGATVVLDGERLGTTPFTARVPAKQGSAWLKVRKRKHVAVKTRVSLERNVQWNVELRQLSR